MNGKRIRKFTRDALIRLSAAKQKAAAHKPAVTVDERKPLDLNEIHRRFWARIGGKE